MPWAFTEHGAIIAASVLNSSRAVEMSVFVVRAFVRLRDFVRGRAELDAKLRQLERRVAGPGHCARAACTNQLVPQSRLAGEVDRPRRTYVVHPRRVEEAGRHFDETVRRIQGREFAVKTPPEPAICKECDLKMLCHAEGIIQRSEAPA